MSGDGQSVVFLFGLKPNYFIWLLGNQGTAQQLGPIASKYEEPGYLPEFQGGPRLLLNNDASRLMYIDSSSRDEIFLLDTTPVAATQHVTSDANFVPYIGIGVLPFFSGHDLLVGIGNANAVDWFTTNTTRVLVDNLTNTGALPVAPFAEGTLDPVASLVTTSGVLISSELQTNGSSSLRRIDPVAGTSTVMISGQLGAMQLGESLNGNPSILVPSSNGDILIDNNQAMPILTGPAGVQLSPEIGSLDANFSVLIVSDATGRAIPVIKLANGNLILLPMEMNLRQFILTRGGGAVLNGQTLRYLDPLRALTIPSNHSIRILLSGAGA